MKTEIQLPKRAVALYLQGRKKSEIARTLQRSRPWVDRWLERYRGEAPTQSLQDRSRAPKQRRCSYPERIQRMVVQIREDREAGKRGKYQYALLSAQAIYYELRELGLSSLAFFRYKKSCAALARLAYKMNKFPPPIRK